MSTHPLPSGSRSLAFRLARAACPEPERAWLSALVTETTAIESRGARLRWVLGAAALVLGANVRQVLALLRRHPVGAIALAAAGWTLLASPSLLAYEVFNTEDDLFLLAATLLSGALVVATIFALLHDNLSARVTLGGRL
jgi:hypothetical protein